MELLKLAALAAFLYVLYINRDRIRTAVEEFIDDGLDAEPVAKLDTNVTNFATPISGTVAPNSGTVPTFSPVSGNLVSDQVMKRGVRFLSTGSLGIIQAFALEPGTSRVELSETMGTGDKVQYNLWISDGPAGVARDGVPSLSLPFNAATLFFTPSEKTLYANVRALVDGGRPFYIQAN